MNDTRKAYGWTAATLAAAAVLMTQPALALGSVDPVAAVTGLGTWIFLFATAFVPLIFLYKGLHAMMNGEHFGRHIAGLLGGLVLVVGGYTIMNKYGG